MNCLSCLPFTGILKWRLFPKQFCILHPPLVAAVSPKVHLPVPNQPPRKPVFGKDHCWKAQFSPISQQVSVSKLSCRHPSCCKWREKSAVGVHRGLPESYTRAHCKSHARGRITKPYQHTAFLSRLTFSYHCLSFLCQMNGRKAVSEHF